MSTPLAEGKRLSDWLKGEVQTPTDFSRQEITVLSGEVLVTGTVLAQLTSGGKWVGLDVGASSGAGSDAAKGILLLDCDATDGDQRAVAIVRDAVVSDNGITWAANASAGDIVTHTAELLALGIVVREGA